MGRGFELCRAEVQPVPGSAMTQLAPFDEQLAIGVLGRVVGTVFAECRTRGRPVGSHLFDVHRSPPATFERGHEVGVLGDRIAHLRIAKAGRAEQLDADDAR